MFRDLNLCDLFLGPDFFRYLASEYRRAPGVHCRLWGSSYGPVVDSIILQCTYETSFRSSQEALL